MTLAVGTALSHGAYVIEAWVAEDTIGPVYLAMDVASGQWVQLRVLGSRNPGALPEATARQDFYRYLEQVTALKHPVLPRYLGGFEEEGVCYQAFTNPAGTPLDQLITPTAPLSPQLSLSIIRQLVEALQALRWLGWAGLRLTPDQLWLNPQAQTIVLTGFDLTPGESEPLASPDSVAPEETELVRSLSHLLYLLLTGQQATDTKAPLTVDIRRRYPALPTSVDTALEQGSPRDRALPTIPLTDWVALLPAPETLPAEPQSAEPPSAEPQSSELRPAAQPHDRVSPATVAIASNRESGILSQASAPATAQRSYQPVLALLLTGLTATVGGLGLGFYARLQPPTSSTQERLNPNQSFPALPDWNTNTLWQPWDEAPTVRDRPDYGNAPAGAPPTDFIPEVQEPAAPAPAVAQPEFAPDPLDQAVEPWDSPVEPGVTAEPVPPVAPTPIPEPDAAPALEPVQPPLP
ncbi:hypothetical protein IQ254_20580 [Nodosilinea sp. LEGE 07088]|uniref:hypothetical protein n=1 Tax=Nodosilinea sp. LEGE 07088 TaxID=2777968 RepID=UPI00187FAD3D|nr:hypothetical protein [Nodosilinea sp. LEGE 07088]MBE9139563.1 hypothetical protein [Nodosilinea sp. LEGE 07088]